MVHTSQAEYILVLVHTYVLLSVAAGASAATAQVEEPTAAHASADDVADQGAVPNPAHVGPPHISAETSCHTPGILVLSTLPYDQLAVRPASKTG